MYAVYINIACVNYFDFPTSVCRFAFHMKITIKVTEYRYDLEIKGQSQMFLISVTLLTIKTLLSCIDEVCLYLAQYLLIMS